MRWSVLGALVFVLLVAALSPMRAAQARDLEQITGSGGVDLSMLQVTPNARLGLAFPGSDPKYYRYVAEAGIGVVRISAAWKWLEQGRDNFDFTGLDRRIHGLQTLGLTPFVTFESNADWATIEQTHKVKNAQPKDLAHWARFVETVVERYDGDGRDDMPGLTSPVRYWQVANEWISDSNRSGGWAGSTADLIAYVSASRTAIKAADPEAIVVMGGVAAFNMDLLLVARDGFDFSVRQSWSATSETVMTRAEIQGQKVASIIDNRVLPVLRQAPFDVASAHLYGPEDRDGARLDLLRRLSNKPVVSSECGGPTLDYGGEYSGAAHFRAVIERNLNVLAAGGQFCLWFRLGESGGSTYGNARTALYDAKARPKPGVFAYRALGRLLDTQATVAQQRPGHFLIQRGAGQEISVAWGPPAQDLRREPEFYCLSAAQTGQLSTDSHACAPGAVTFAGAGLWSLFSPFTQ
ncbi:hypothetical protein [Leisingera sp. S232]|uniref:hypothetical protein n=1 Tax=Leisingera sp. S232 TaxID=3415132 RepID=UPI003C7DEC57